MRVLLPANETDSIREMLGGGDSLTGSGWVFAPIQLVLVARIQVDLGVIPTEGTWE